MPVPSRPPEYFTVAEVAARWGVSPKTVRRLVAAGELRAIRIGRAVRIHTEELERYERAKTPGAA